MRLIRIFVLIVLSACSSLTEQEKLERLLASDQLKIQRNFYGGLAGYGEEVFYLELIENMNEYKIGPVSRRSESELVRSFINDAYATSDKEKVMSESCLGIDREYILSTGSTSLTVRPDEKCDSIFELIIGER